MSVKECKLECIIMMMAKLYYVITYFPLQMKNRLKTEAPLSCLSYIEKLMKVEPACLFPTADTNVGLDETTQVGNAKESKSILCSYDSFKIIAHSKFSANDCDASSPELWLPNDLQKFIDRKNACIRERQEEESCRSGQMNSISDPKLHSSIRSTEPGTNRSCSGVTDNLDPQGNLHEASFCEAATEGGVSGSFRNHQTDTRFQWDSVSFCKANEIMPQVNKTMLQNHDNCSANCTENYSLRQNSHSYPWDDEVQSILTQIFGLRSFRPLQREAINTALSGEDCFVLLPTGGGKSLCYQLTALVRKNSGITIVISPLVSLIQDQVDGLRSMGIQAAALTGSSNEKVRRQIFEEWALLAKNQIDADLCSLLVYTTPEMFGQSNFMIRKLQNLYENKKLSCMVIDEAHCISQWGHDFRPDYRKLRILKELFPQCPVMALTATATSYVTKDILEVLNIPTRNLFRGTFNRPNLRYMIFRHCPASKKKVNSISGISFDGNVAKLITDHYKNLCGIVYCLSQKDTEEMAQLLCSAGIKAAHYHAGSTSRQETQDKWMKGKVHVVCATIAFGMGINKPDVRFVIHATMPRSMEGYYQESGRAGRDLKPSDCILLYNPSSKSRLEKLITMGNSSPQMLKFYQNQIAHMIEFCSNDTICRRKQQLDFFGEQTKSRFYCIDEKSNLMCDVCSSKVGDKWELAEQNVTDHVLNLLRLHNCDDYITAKQLAASYKGKNTRSKRAGKAPKDKFSEAEQRGNSSSELTLENVENIIRNMIYWDIFEESLKRTQHRSFANVTALIHITQSGRNLLASRGHDKKLTISFRRYPKDVKSVKLNMKPVECGSTGTNSAVELYRTPSGTRTKAPKVTQTIATNTENENFGVIDWNSVSWDDNCSPMKSQNNIDCDSEALRGQLRDRLAEVRRELATQENMKEYSLISNNALDELSLLILRPTPPSMDDVKNVHGMGKNKLRKYGRQFLEPLRMFRSQYYGDCAAYVSDSECAQQWVTSKESTHPQTEVKQVDPVQRNIPVATKLKGKVHPVVSGRHNTSVFTPIKNSSSLKSTPAKRMNPSLNTDN